MEVHVSSFRTRSLESLENCIIDPLKASAMHFRAFGKLRHAQLWARSHADTE
jgi:hypothetical protein